jgi:putative two-component system response regulator
MDRTAALSLSQIELKESQLEVIARLARAGEQHDCDTGLHTQRVAITAALIAEKMELQAGNIETIRQAAPLHDVGKIGVSDAILLKPGKLTPAEYAIMQTHCQLGAQLLSGGRSDVVQMAERIALTHHEKWNGTGYPYGLKKEAIPVEGRILAVADVFDALTHIRPYKKAWTVEEALDEICRQAGTHFDPQVVEALLELSCEDLI